MVSGGESLLDNVRFSRYMAFGLVLGAGLTVSARTVALWPIEWDPVSGVKDFRCAVDPLNNLVNSDGAADTSPIGWNLPPNPDGMTAFSGALDEWRITCGVRTAEDILFRPRKGMVLIFR